MFKKTAILMIVIFSATIFSGFNFKPIAKKFAEESFFGFLEYKVRSFLKSDDDKWIKSKDGVYLWNPNPIEGESVRWEGKYIENDGRIYAHGFGRTTWFLNGYAIEVSEGNYNFGKQDGMLKSVQRTEKNGQLVWSQIFYSKWKNGVEIED